MSESERRTNEQTGQHRDSVPAEHNGQGRASDLGGRGRGSAGASNRVGDLSGGELNNGSANNPGRVSDTSTEQRVK